MVDVRIISFIYTCVRGETFCRRIEGRGIFKTNKKCSTKIYVVQNSMGVFVCLKRVNEKEVMIFKCQRRAEYHRPWGFKCWKLKNRHAEDECRNVEFLAVQVCAKSTRLPYDLLRINFVILFLIMSYIQGPVCKCRLFSFLNTVFRTVFLNTA